MDLLPVPNIVWTSTSAMINRVIRVLNALISMDLTVVHVLQVPRVIL